MGVPQQGQPVVLRAAVEPASFRDRAGTVVHADGRVLRVVSPAAAEAWRAFASTSVASSLMESGQLIESRELVGVSVEGRDGVVLEHRRVPLVSYSYEWPASLLRKAALLHLDLLDALLPAGFILQDATPNNVLFEGTRPVFVDTGSIVRYRPGEPWQALQQMLDTMVSPLLLAAHKGLAYHAWLRGAGDAGLPIHHVAPLFGLRDRRRRGVLRYVTLRAAVERRTERTGPTRHEIGKAGVPLQVLQMNVRQLRAVVEGLRFVDRRRAWIDYAGGTYDEAQRARKHEAVLAAVRVLGGEKPVVWDIGCNTGEFSRLVAPHADYVVAMDEDVAVLDRAVADLDAAGCTNVTPLCVNFADRPPAQGWRGLERPSFDDRARPGLVLALAVLHHLVLSKNLPADQVVAEFARLAPTVIVEFVDASDAMAQRLSRNAGEGRNELPTRDRFEALCAEHFETVSRTELTPTRTLYALRRK